MSTERTTPEPLLLPALLALGPALAASPAAQEPKLTAETYGRASGDTPSLGPGLVLELARPRHE